MTRERWIDLMMLMGLERNLDEHERVVAAYAQPHRHYHTGTHVSYCLEQLDLASEQARRPGEVEFALWYHDVVYDPGSKRNEEESARWAESFLHRAGADASCRQRVRDHIIATQHEVGVVDLDSALVVDVDLSILGSDDDTFWTFERNVRKEYRSVPLILYRRGRRKVLESFLERDSIYATHFFVSRLESAARRNLEAAIAAL